MGGAKGGGGVVCWGHQQLSADNFMSNLVKTPYICPAGCLCLLLVIEVFAGKLVVESSSSQNFTGLPRIVKLELVYSMPYEELGRLGSTGLSVNCLRLRS